MGAVKNILFGLIMMGVYMTTTILIPYFTFDFVNQLSMPITETQSLDLQMAQGDIDTIFFWLISLGLVISGLAFFSYSSPRKSRRAVVFSILQVLANGFYLWSYKFSGAAELTIDIVELGSLSLDLTETVSLYLGAYSLIIFYKLWKLIEVDYGQRKELREKKKLLPETTFGKDGGAL